MLIQGIEERVGAEMPKLDREEGVKEKEVMKEVREARRMAVTMMDEEGWDKNKKRKRCV